MANQSRMDIKALGGRFSDNGITLPYWRVLPSGEVVPAIHVIGVHTTHAEHDPQYKALYKPDVVQYHRLGHWNESRIRSIKSAGLINPISVVRISVPKDDDDWPQYARGTNQFAVVAGRHRCIDGGIHARRAYNAGEVSSVDAIHARVQIDWRYDVASAAQKAVDENLFVRRLSPLEIGAIIVEKESQGYTIDEIVSRLPNPISPAHGRQMKAIYTEGCAELHQRLYEGTIKITAAMKLARKGHDEQRKILDGIKPGSSAAESDEKIAKAEGKKTHKPPSPKQWRKALENSEGAHLQPREIMLMQLMAGRISLTECTEEIRAMFSPASTGKGDGGKGEESKDRKFELDDIAYFMADGIPCKGTVIGITKREIKLDGVPQGYSRWLAREPYHLRGNADILLCTHDEFQHHTPVEGGKDMNDADA